MAKKNKNRVKISLGRGVKLYNPMQEYKSTIDKINANITAVSAYDALAEQLSKDLAVIDKPSINFQGDEMRIDMNEFIKTRWDNTNIKQATKILNEINTKANRAYDALQFHTQGEIVNTVFADILIQTRESKKYEAMSGSAEKRVGVEEEEFWKMTVVKALGNGQIGDKVSFMNKLNVRLKNKNYETFDNFEIAEMIRQSSRM